MMDVATAPIIIGMAMSPATTLPIFTLWLASRGRPRLLVSDILRTEYRDVPGGLSGNDDAGQMSAWQVFSMLGFYPVCPGSADYVIGLPQFRCASIGRLTIETQGEGSYIQRMTWNGEPYISYILTHEMVVSGGRLIVELDEKHN